VLLVKTRVKASDVQGLGLFADEFIPKGTPIWEFTPGLDSKLTEDEFNALSPLAREHLERYAYKSTVDGMYVICLDDARYFNHSSTPNVIDKEIPNDPEGINIAARDIQLGEELLCDYAEFDVDSKEGKEPYVKA
jgi:SET domain-containing protein